MGLRDTLSKAAQTAFTAAGDVPVTTYYYQTGSTVYDASTGTTSTGTSQYVVSMIFSRFSTGEILDESVLPSDQLGLIPQANISTIPQVDDYLMAIESGVSARYDVIGIQQDPASALWKLQLRKP